MSGDERFHVVDLAIGGGAAVVWDAVPACQTLLGVSGRERGGRLRLFGGRWRQPITRDVPMLVRTPQRPEIAQITMTQRRKTCRLNSCWSGAAFLWRGCRNSPSSSHLLGRRESRSRRGKTNSLDYV